MKKQTLLFVLTAMLAAGVGALIRHFVMPPELPPSPPVKPAFLNSPLQTKLPDSSGRIQKLVQWQGKILVVNFWGTWCPPCLTEIPELIAIQQQYRDKNVQIIGIAIDSKQAVLKYQEKQAVNYPILIAGDSGMAIAKAWGNATNAVPFSVIFNPQGEIIHRQLGEISREELLELIQPMLDIQVVKAGLRSNDNKLRPLL
jgi:thiol-disulfide isomerase/thioredoxin